MRQNLTSARRAKKLTQEQLGRLTGLSKSAICRLERGQSDGSRKTWQKLSEVLGQPPEDLWRQGS